MELMLRAGADIARLFDGERWSIERFASHLSRLHVLRSGGSAPLVLLTRTNPIALTVFHARRVLEEAVPKLVSAVWLIFHDEAEDPFFGVSATDCGEFDAPLDSAPIWSSPNGGQFLILSARINEPWIVAKRIGQLEAESLPQSGLQPSDATCPIRDASLARAASRRG